MEMFHLTTEYEVNLAYRTNSIRDMVADEWRKFIQRSEQDLVVRLRERLILRTPVAEDTDIVLPFYSTARSTTHIGDPVIAAAARASAQAETDPHTLLLESYQMGTYVRTHYHKFPLDRVSLQARTTY
jgi:hypothetical protein